MKKINATLGLLCLGLGVLILAGCPSKNNPTTPSAPAAPTNTSSPTSTPTACVNSQGTPCSATPTPSLTATGTPTSTATVTSSSTPTSSPTLTRTVTLTPTATPNFTTTPVSGFGWGEGFVVGNNAVGNDVYAELQLNGQPVTNARVVLNGPAMSGPLTLPYSGPQTVSAVFSLYEAVGGFAFQAGQPYTITAAAGGVTSTAAVTAAGGVFSVAPDGSAVSWTVDGNESSIGVYPQGSLSTPLYSAAGAGNSPVSIPVSVYASPGAYTLILDVDNLSAGVSGGTLIYPNRLGASAQYIATFVASPTPTSTPTLTPTFTPSLTFTPTATFTPSDTPTGTSTLTPTSTITPTPTATPCAMIGYGGVLPSYGLVGNNVYLGQYTLPASATQLTSYSIYLYANTGTTNHYEMALYADNAGNVGNLVAGSDTGEQTFDGTASGADGWQTVTLSSPVPVTGGGVYWLAYMTDGDTGTYVGAVPSYQVSNLYPVSFNAFPSDGSGGYGGTSTTAESVYASFCP